MRIFLFDKRILIVIALVIIGALMLSVKISVPTAKPSRELPIYNVDRSDKAISVTINCAWNDNDIDDIIEVLDKFNCISTFFVVGDWVERYPEAVKKLSDAGHEIGNHSYNHAHYSKLSKDEMKADMDKSDALIEKITGKKSTMFRAPYGEYNTTLVRACIETGRFCIQWDVDSLDWRDLSADEITNRVVSKTVSGSIILLHNGTPNTYIALTKILPHLAEQGYKFLPVSELIYKENFIINNAGMQSIDNS